MHVSEVILSLGTNLGDRKINLERAIELCGKRVGDIVLISSIFETAAWGLTDQNAFYNQIIMCKTRLNPREVLETILSIETGLGRIREKKWGPRLIDLDILFYDKIVVNKQGLQIPHPYLAERRFILEPLFEILPEFIHPITGKSVAEMLRDCPDQLEVLSLKNSDG